MEIYLDTGVIDEIAAAKELGVLRGVTTNPSHMFKAGHHDARRAIQEICWTGDVPTSMEVTEPDAAGMLEQAAEISTWSPNVVVKLPTTTEGLKSMSVLSRQEHAATCAGCPHLPGCPIRRRHQEAGTLRRKPPINATVIFAPGQAVAASAAGAAYVSPFVGRLDSIGQEGLTLLRDIAEIFAVHDIPTRIISAAMRNPIQVTESFKAGAQICTMGWAVLDQLIHHPLTEAAVEGFTRDWAELQKLKGEAAVPTP